MHGTTRQVLSLITNPLDVMCANLQTVRGMMGARPDILGAHLRVRSLRCLAKVRMIRMLERSGSRIC